MGVTLATSATAATPGVRDESTPWVNRPSDCRLLRSLLAKQHWVNISAEGGDKQLIGTMAIANSNRAHPHTTPALATTTCGQRTCEPGAHTCRTAVGASLLLRGFVAGVGGFRRVVGPLARPLCRGVCVRRGRQLVQRQRGGGHRVGLGGLAGEGEE